MSHANALSGLNAVYPNVPAGNDKQPINANTVPRSCSNGKRRRNVDGSSTEVVHQANENDK